MKERLGAVLDRDYVRGFRVTPDKKPGDKYSWEVKEPEPPRIEQDRMWQLENAALDAINQERQREEEKWRQDQERDRETERNQERQREEERQSKEDRKYPLSHIQRRDSRDLYRENDSEKGGDGGGEEESYWPESPFEPRLHQVFRMMAYDHHEQKDFTQNDFKGGTDIPLHEDIVKRAPPPEVAYEIQKKVDRIIKREKSFSLRKLMRTDPRGLTGDELEVTTALFVGPELTGFNEKYTVHSIGKRGDFDISTKDLLIEVTRKISGKKEQIDKYNAYVKENEIEKKVILFAPNYGKKSKRAIEDIEKIAYFENTPKGLDKLIKDIYNGKR